MAKKINQLPTSSISDSDLAFIGNSQDGQLFQTSYKAAKDYFQSGAQISFDTGSLATTASLNSFTASIEGQLTNVFLSQSGYTQLSLFNAYTGSENTRVTNVFTSQSNYTPTSSFQAYSASVVLDSGSFNSRISSLSGSVQSLTGSFNSFSSSFVQYSSSVNSRLTSSMAVLNFIVGDGQSFTPSSGSTVFSSSLIQNRTIIQMQQEGFTIAPISRSVSWFSYTGSTGKINLNNTLFVPDAYYQIIYF